MQPDQASKIKRIKLAGIVSGFLLVGLIGFLLWENYISLAKLHDSAMKNLVYDTEKLAMATSYFYSERKDDLKDLSKSRELSIFFENKALGMSMEYGLKASLIAISKSFDRLLNEKKFNAERIYTRIVFIDSSGDLLVDRMPLKSAKSEPEKEWKKYLAPDESEPVIIAEHNGELLSMAVSTPCFFKNRYAGQILARISPYPLYKYFIKTEDEFSSRALGIVCPKGKLHFTTKESLPAYKVQFDFRKAESWKPYRFDAVYNGAKSDMIAIRVPVKNTPFSLAVVSTASEVFGDAPPWRLPLAMGILLVVILGAIAHLWRLNTRNEEERQKLESKLRNAREMEALGTLAGGVAHDLNNVLGGIVSYPELLLMQIPEDSPLRKPISTIQKSGEKAAAIIQDMLTLARRGVDTREVVNLNDIISNHLKTPEHEKLKFFHPDVRIVTNLEESLLNIMGSPVHLSKTVMNLISNAAEAMPDGGTIVVSTQNRYIDKPVKGYEDVSEGDYVTLTVSDTGIGIPAEDVERIFEPFYTKKVMGRSGTGLGMTVVWGTVKDHNGYIDVQSTEGKGTTFILSFPVTRKKSAKDEPLLSIEDYTGRGESILVVDDVEEQRKIASGMLKKLGYSVTTISSGEEAVEYMKDHSADLLVLDMVMDPGIDGLETYKRILKLHPGQKAIIASGFSESKHVKEAQKQGARAYVKKPYLMEKIGIAVRNELDR